MGYIMKVNIINKKSIYIIKLMRPKQWIKNFFVFGALIFSCKFLELNNVINTLITFILFSLMSSTVYIMNDIVDVEKDRIHPKKKNRPIASGQVSIKEAILLMVMIFVITLIIAIIVNKILAAILFIYFLNNVIYSFKVKNIVILDVISIAFGFILRVISGGIVIGATLSNWILLCTFSISLFLGFEKRSNELCKLESKANKHRKILDEYSKELLDQFTNISLTCTIITYAMYTFFAYEHSYMIITNIFVVYGLLRYKYITVKNGVGGSPTEAVIGDKSIIIDVLLWVVTSVMILLIVK